MAKQAKSQEAERKAGPKFGRSVLPENFQIRRAPTPMADLLKEAEGTAAPEASSVSTGVNSTPVETTPVKSTPVETVVVITELPSLDVFLDQVLPRFPPARQAILLRLFRWSQGQDHDLVVSTPRLAAKTNMDEKSCRSHLHALIADGYLERSSDGQHHARFGGHDRRDRGLILRLSSSALSELIE
jgi:hypothetical protein